MPASVLLQLRQCICIALMGLAVLSSSSIAHAEAFSAEAVKATFLQRFAFYVEWPEGAIPASTFTVGVTESEPLARQLEILFDVQLLYIGPSMSANGRKIRNAASRMPILLVTDSPDGLAEGAVINFLPTTRNVRFEISLTSAARAGLIINSQLLSVAVNVERRTQTWSPCGGSYDRRDFKLPCEARMARLVRLQPVIHFSRSF
jgi:YfiR/HmsC-like